MIVQPPWKMPGRLAAARDLSRRSKQKKVQWVISPGNSWGVIAQRQKFCKIMDFLYCLNN